MNHEAETLIPGPERTLEVYRMGAALGGLGGAGLAIGRGAIAIPAVAVVAIPAVAVGAVAFGAWKVAKAFRKKSR